jgi:glycerol-3-phosphate dehydrogenase (NAD(P)+)
VTIVGAGAWGTALAIQARRAGNQVALVARPASLDALRTGRESPYLKGVFLSESIEVTDAIPDGADLVLWAVPTRHLRTSMRTLSRVGAPAVICSKGMEAGSNHLPLEIAAEESPRSRLAILGGPNFAHEVAQGLAAAAVVAGLDAGHRDFVRATIGTSAFRLYGNDDPVGAQVGGAAKNVIAIAAGAVMGARLGENARAALITRGLSEISRAAVAMGGRLETVMGLSGLGDLLLTCTGLASRNFRLGYALGEGKSLQQALDSQNGVTEGIFTAAALLKRAAPTEMPICKAVASLLAGQITLNHAMGQLLARPLRDE